MKAVNPSTVTAAELFAEPPAVVDREDPVAATMELNLDVIWACVALERLPDYVEFALTVA